MRKMDSYKYFSWKKYFFYWKIYINIIPKRSIYSAWMNRYNSYIMLSQLFSYASRKSKQSKLRGNIC